jgi:hypothetical protein
MLKIQNPINRRALIGHAATALAATTAAATALAWPTMEDVDPIFGALNAHSCAWAEVEASIAAMGIIEDSLGDGDGRDHSRVVIGHYKDFESGEVTPVYAFSHGDIDVAPGLSKKSQRDLHAEFDADVARLEAIHQASGLRAARDREKAAWDDWRRLLCVAAATVPTTAPGVAAFVDFMREQIHR